MDYSSFLNRVSLARQPSAIRSLAPFLSIKGMISLGGGLPNPIAFPFSGVDLRLKDGKSISISGNVLATALQYGPTAGLPTFVSQLRSLTSRYHTTPKYPWDILVTSGGQDGLSRTFEAILDTESAILVENPTYPGALAALRPLGCDIVGISTDRNGLIPDALNRTLSGWKRSTRPKALYIVPVGQNPRGCSLSIERKRMIYSIAQKHNILILEDDPYHFLIYDFAKYRRTNQSFLSLDVDGRVLRFDTLSKVLSSGLRLGWVTGPSELVNRLNLHMQSGALHASSLSQAVASSLLQSWGDNGFAKHILNVQKLYENKRNEFIAACSRHLVGLAEWEIPIAGMFVWMRLLGIKDSGQVVREGAKTHKILMVPGESFIPEMGAKSEYVRASFSTATVQEMDTAMNRLSRMLRDHKHR